MEVASLDKGGEVQNRKGEREEVGSEAEAARTERGCTSCKLHKQKAVGVNMNPELIFQHSLIHNVS